MIPFLLWPFGRYIISFVIDFLCLLTNKSRMNIEWPRRIRRPSYCTGLGG